jgi:hypothetical protein
MIQKSKRHGAALPRLFESILVNRTLTIQDSALGATADPVDFALGALYTLACSGADDCPRLWFLKAS